MPIVFKGYAITSADGFIADDAGRMPDRLRFDADWALFQAALDQADITLLGRHTHEAAPNVKKRERLVVSRGVRAMLRGDDGAWWVNSEHVTPTSAVTVAVGSDASVAVVGGTGVFSWILDETGFDEFHLSVAHKVRLGQGRPLLDGARDLDAALRQFEARGLTLSKRAWLDREAGLELLQFAAAGTG